MSSVPDVLETKFQRLVAMITTSIFIRLTLDCEPYPPPRSPGDRSARSVSINPSRPRLKGTESSVFAVGSGGSLGRPAETGTGWLNQDRGIFYHPHTFVT